MGGVTSSFHLNKNGALQVFFYFPVFPVLVSWQYYLCIIWHGGGLPCSNLPTYKDHPIALVVSRPALCLRYAPQNTTQRICRPILHLVVGGN